MTAPGRKRILIADDDPAIARMLVKVLEHEYETVVARSGTEAMALAYATAPDLVLLDVMMPGIDGFRVAEVLRHEPRLARTRVIFLTARAAPTDVVRGIQAGARHYITKPFKVDEVREKVKKAWR
jgi:DNA-binding response OmpR family regulator